MPDHSPAPGWWLASDGRWYAPELRPGAAPVQPPPAEPAPFTWPTGPGTPPAPTGAPVPQSGLPQFAPPPRPAYAGFPPTGPPPSGPPPPAAPGQYPGVHYGPPWPYPDPTVAASTNGLAVASLVLSIVSVFGLLSILAIIFGFVARRQIARSRGRQKGAGLALAGIIVGFVTLFLGVLIAIPTFIGVQHGRSDSAARPPTPIRLGAPIAGGSASPIVWTPESISVDTTVTPVPGGVRMHIGALDQVEWANVPLDTPMTSAVALSSDVAITGGTFSNAIGLGCASAQPDVEVAFLVHQSGDWNIQMWQDHRDQVVDEGTTSVVKAFHPNRVTIACSPASGPGGGTDLDLEINGTPVASDTVTARSAFWTPAVTMCSCHGPSEGTFTDVRYFSGPDIATS